MAILPSASNDPCSIIPRVSAICSRKWSMRAAACEASAESCMNVARDSRLEGIGSKPASCRRGDVDLKCLRIDDHAVVPGSRLHAHETFHDVLPDKLWVAL